MTVRRSLRTALAGVLDPAAGASHRERVEAALRAEGEGEVAVESAGPLVAGTWGARPLRDADGRLCLLDGELHEAEGADLLAGWRTHGEALPGRLRGEYAVVLYDPATARGLAFCDHMGARALWYAERGGRLWLASDGRQLLRLLDRTPEPDPLALAHWLSVTTPDAERTLFAGVRRLPAGHFLRFSAAGTATARYWLPGAVPRFEGGAEAAAGELQARLRTSVARRLPADGPAGVMLSGGLDSSSVGGVAATLIGDRLRGYSAVFPDHPEADESALIEELRRAFGIAGVSAPVRSGSIVAAAVGHIRRWSAPPTSPNLYFLDPLLAGARADGVEVMLDGEGGDELFGAAPYLVADRLLHGRVRSAAALARLGVGRPDLPPRQLLRVLATVGARGALPYGVHERLRRRRNAGASGADWLRPELARAYFDAEDPWRWKREPGPRWLAYQRHAVTGTGSAHAYEHVRRRAADAGLVARHPLVDPDVIDHLLAVPPELSFSDLSRPLLRRAVAGIVPDPVRLRTGKSNFNGPFHEALRGPDLPLVRRLLGDPGLRLGAYVEPAAVRALAEGDPERFPGGLRAWAIYVWRLTTAELWLGVLAGDEAISSLFPP